MCEKILKGRYVQIRSITENDAQFSVEIRQDKEKNKFLHTVEANIDKQIAWIKKQQNSEGDYFFIAEALDGKKIGTVGIYDIKEKTGHLGRLLMIGNPFQTFEAVLLSMEFAYNILGLEELYGDVHVDNTPSLNISEAVGMHFKEPEYDGELDRWVKYGIAYKSEFPKYKGEVEALIYRD
ncbi:butyryltransferase [Anaerovibrio sp. JC8]|nr:butyryltransferase [Anaerovibrio sp. JC8]